MLLNFCDHTLNPNFSCDKPSHDGYAVSNLASKIYSERQQGFLAYGSPPATVTVDFVGAANIRHVIIWPQVLSQKSVGLEISIRSAEKKKQLWHSFSATASQQSGTTYVGHDDSYYRVGSIILQGNDKGVVFTRHESVSAPDNDQPNIPGDFVQRIFFRHSALSNADSLQIKIFKTTSSVPALKKLEVWGVPGSLCSRRLVRDIFNMWHSSSHYQLHNCHNILTEQSSTSEKSEENAEEKSVSDIEVPEEFLDAITCDIMVLPYILPSGKLVDKQTLSKHKEFEARYCRAPSDPFTGKLFTANYHPVPNIDLQRRIGQFLFENGNHKDLQHVPRTTGTKAEHVRENNIQIHKASQMNSDKDVVKCDYSDILNTRTKRKIKTVPDRVETKRFKLCDSSITSSASRSIFGPSSKKSVTTQSKSVLPSAVGDDAFLDATLDLALRDALQGRPSYVNFTNDPERSTLTKPNACGDCSGLETLYKLPCTHLICRTCLVPKVDPLSCSHCGARYQHSDPSRFHLP